MPSRNSTPRNSIVDPTKWNGGTVQIGKHDVQFRKDSFLNTITDVLAEEGRPSLPPLMKGQDQDLSIHFQSKKKLSIWECRNPLGNQSDRDLRFLFLTD